MLRCLEQKAAITVLTLHTCTFCGAQDWLEPATTVHTRCENCGRDVWEARPFDPDALLWRLPRSLADAS